MELCGVKVDDRLLFITDNQMNFDNREDLGWFGTKYDREDLFRDEYGVTSADNFYRWIKYANENKLDAFVLGGDTIDYYTQTNSSMAGRLLRELHMPFVYTYGNHDTYIPWELRFADDDELEKEFYVNGGMECNSLDMGGYVIVSVKNYQNDGTANVSQEALDEFKDIIEDGKPIVLVMHVPLATERLKDNILKTYGSCVIDYDAGDGVIVHKSTLMGENCGYDITDVTKEFIELIERDDSLVKIILSGHLHFSWSELLNNNTKLYVGDTATLNKGTIINIRGDKKDEE